MTDQEKRVAIAEFCGWKRWQNEEKCLYKLGDECPDYIWTRPVEGRPPTVADQAEPPAYESSLDAIHEAEKRLTDEQHARFGFELWCLVGEQRRSFISATAPQRAEALLRVIGRGKE